MVGFLWGVDKKNGTFKLEILIKLNHPCTLVYHPLFHMVGFLIRKGAIYKLKYGTNWKIFELNIIWNYPYTIV